MTTAETGGSCCTQLLAWASTSQVTTLLVHIGMVVLGPLVGAAGYGTWPGETHLMCSWGS